MRFKISVVFAGLLLAQGGVNAQQPGTFIAKGSGGKGVLVVNGAIVGDFKGLKMRPTQELQPLGCVLVERSTAEIRLIRTYF